MADLTDDDVMAILGLFEESEFDYLQFESGDLKLTVSKHGYVPPPAGEAAGPASPQPAAPVAAPPPEPAAPAAPRPTASVVPEGLVAVTAPIVGIFYVASDPQSPPFVSVGEHVGDGDTVGLIEVMKVFTGIRAGVSGEIVEILAVNAQLVEQGEVLFYIRPDP